MWWTKIHSIIYSSKTVVPLSMTTLSSFRNHLVSLVQHSYFFSPLTFLIFFFFLIPLFYPLKCKYSPWLIVCRMLFILSRSSLDFLVQTTIVFWLYPQVSSLSQAPESYTTLSTGHLYHTDPQASWNSIFLNLHAELFFSPVCSSSWIFISANCSVSICLPEPETCDSGGRAKTVE